jgi:hypothetical protein
METGVEVRHLVGGEADAAWSPCAVFVEDGAPPPGAAGRWLQSAVPFVWFDAQFVAAAR